MKDMKLINSFYRDYKKVHQIIEDTIECSKGKVSRVIDRIIIYIFILENLVDSDNKEILKNKIEKEGYPGILDIYTNSNNMLKDSNANQIIKLFEVDEFERDIFLQKETLSKVFTILNKYDWSIQGDKTNKTITPDVLGNVFEKYINQKEMGAYYTDIDTINYINYNTIIYNIVDELNEEISIVNIIKNLDDRYKMIESIEDLIANNFDLHAVLKLLIKKNENLDELKKIKKILENITIADITCGTGAFLIEVVELLIELNENISFRIKSISGDYDFNRIEALINIIENNIYGVDIMEDAIVIAKFRLCLKVLIESINSNNWIEREIRFNLKVGNTLYGEPNLVENESVELVEIALDKDNSTTSNYKFNWKYEFPDVIDRGGFSCIIGNPPYIEYSKMIKNYKIDNCETIKCGNTYAFVIEKAINLLKNDGKIGLIVPISIVSTKRMNTLRNIIEKECGEIFYSNYGDRPDTLFNGVHQKVTILLAKKCSNYSKNIYTSRYLHWYKEERSEIFKRVNYVKNELEKLDAIYKVGNMIDISIINKINKVGKSINKMIVDNGEYYSYLSTRLTFWVKCFNKEKISKEFKQYAFLTQKESLVFTAIMNSSLYYYFWEIVSDEWHITNKELNLFKFNYQLMSEKDILGLCSLSIELENDLENKKVYIGSKQAEYEYRHKNSKLIIDKIDMILKAYYGLSDKEYEYVRDYNIRYRMNDAYNNYINNR